MKREPIAGYVHRKNYLHVLREDETLELVTTHMREHHKATRDELQMLIRTSGSHGRSGCTLYLEREAFLAIKERAFQGRLFDLDGARDDLP
ncbi:MAG TPA: hypothetical protein VI873_02960 [Candidatus Peribacteraceae bacterium]|nr:hypothetical protein [Candidatus Peribacteraceae bacterium]